MEVEEEDLGALREDVGSWNARFESFHDGPGSFRGFFIQPSERQAIDKTQRP